MTILLILACVLAVPVYAAIGALVYSYVYQRTSTDDVDSFVAGLLWPAIIPYFSLIYWPIRLALRLPGWLESRRNTLPRATAKERAR